MSTTFNEKIENAVRARNYCKGKTIFDRLYISADDSLELKRIYVGGFTHAFDFDSRKDEENE